jgi:Flp pilus assembly protein TadG
VKPINGPYSLCTVGRSRTTITSGRNPALHHVAHFEKAPRKGSTVGPRKPSGRRRVGREDGAETVEFAIIVVLLIALLYGIISVGLTMGAKATLTEAASDAARAGIVQSSPDAAKITAVSQANNDLAWMHKGTCGASGVLTCVATEINCPANVSQICLKVAVTYNYASSPLFPPVPGLGLTSPTTISASSTLQVSTPTS